MRKSISIDISTTDPRKLITINRDALSDRYLDPLANDAIVRNKIRKSRPNDSIFT